MGTQVEVPKTVPEETASQAVTGTPMEVLATKKLEKYINAAENDFEIDLDYSPGLRVTELSNSDRQSPSSIHGSGVSGLYSATPCLKMG